MARKQGKLARFEAEREALKAQMHEIQQELGEVVTEGRALITELQNSVSRGRRLEIDARLPVLVRRRVELDQDYERLGAQKIKLNNQLVPLRARLRDARETLQTLRHPEPWQKELLARDYSPYSLAQLEERARQAIRELTS